MLKIERQDKIMSLLDMNDILSTKSIADSLGVTGMTIRRDIYDLENQGLVVKIYGGVQKVQKSLKELSTNEKINNNIAEKEEIGRIMDSLISDNMTIYLGAGTTILHALKMFTKKNLFIVTNSFIAFKYIIEETDYKVVLCGGEYNKNTEEFNGDLAERAFENYNIDIAFASTNGIYSNNITTSNVENGRIQKAAYKVAKVKAILADHTKLNKSDVYTFHHLDDVDFLITDSLVNSDIADYYGQMTKILNKEVS